jgi:hypothetical protein
MSAAASSSPCDQMMGMVNSALQEDTDAGYREAQARIAELHSAGVLCARHATWAGKLINAKFDLKKHFEEVSEEEKEELERIMQDMRMMRMIAFLSVFGLSARR